MTARTMNQVASQVIAFPGRGKFGAPGATQADGG
jgi:hypothetical protein